mmetsp:Transcript_39037/g.87597  ORF Transcript_39037/g.87597 Transcript_39037/m.87597 type:complete len:241 (+) Transcript_39037:159-881(+)
MPVKVAVGHPRHKVSGASPWYVLGAALLCLPFLGGLADVVHLLAGSAVVTAALLGVGMAVVRQALEATDSRHYPALVIGCCCMLAEWVATLGSSFPSAVSISAGGPVIVAVVSAQLVADITDLRFVQAGGLALSATVATFFGLMHSNNPVNLAGDLQAVGGLTLATEDEASRNDGWRWGVCYALIAGCCAVAKGLQRRGCLEASRAGGGSARAGGGAGDGVPLRDLSQEATVIGAPVATR